MLQSYLELEKYWLTQSGYFRPATTVALGMVITDGKMLFCHGISKVNVDKEISTIEYNNMTVYYFFNNPFSDDFGSPYLNLPPITIDYRVRPHKRSRYTPVLLPDTISVASENSISTFTTPSDLPQLFPLTSDDPKPFHAMNKDNPY